MNHRLNGPISWLLLPGAIMQGLQVRARTPRLLPPAGPKAGHFEGHPDSEYDLLILGDSSAAGVGSDDIRESLGPQLAEILHRRTGRTVRWRVAGANSAIAEQVRDHVVPNLPAAPHTHVILCIGMNDLKNFLTANRFKKGFGGLLYAVHSKWPQAAIIWTPLLDMTTVPTLPRLLGTVLQLRAELFNRLGRQLCRERHAIVAPPLDSTNPAGFSLDGFHASPAGYHYWAGVLADTILADAAERSMRIVPGPAA